METKNYTQTRFWKFCLIAILPGMLFLAACNKKGGDNGQVPLNPYVGTAACNGGNCAAMLTKVQTQTTNGNFQATFDILTPNTMPMTGGYGGAYGGGYGGYGGYGSDPTKAILYYSGPVYLSGFINIQSAGDWYLCGAMPGQYTVTTMQQGQAAYGVISNVRVQAASSTGGTIMFTVYNGILNNTDGGGVREGVLTNRLVGANLFLEMVNGQPCSTIVTN